MRVCSNTFRIDAKNPIDYLALTQNEINRYGKDHQKFHQIL